MIIFDANLHTKNKGPLAPPAGLDESRRHTSHEEGLPTEGPQYIRGNPSIEDSIHAKVFGAGLAAHVVSLRRKLKLLASIQ